MEPEQTNPEGFPSDVLVDLRPGNGRGLREQLEYGLRTAIQRRRLVAGTLLPPTRVVAAELGISRSVVVEAYGNLAADGYLEARQGAGTRVRFDARDDPPRPARHHDRAGFFERPRRASPHGAPPIRLLGGLPDPALFPRAQWMGHYRAVLAELPDPELTYPPARGAEALRFALSAYLGRVRGVAAVPDRLLICAGFTQGLTLVCRALRREGARRVAVEEPCFGLHRKAIAMTGLEPVPVAVDEHGLDVSALDDHDVAAVLVAPAHSYPTGGTLDVARRHGLVAWARRHDALIIEDDYDAEFRYDRVPIGALHGLAPDRVVYVGSASKTVSPSLRLGWLAAPARLVDAVEREKTFDDMGSGLLEQLAFARFVDRGDFSRYLRRVRPIYRRRRDATIDALAELLPAARWHGASGGLHLHVTLPDGVDERALAAAAYERGVLVEDAAWHWANRSKAPPALVLGYGSASERTIRRGIAIVAEAMAATVRS
ncbi:MAG TPA: PLP-dependent aminotransferase family protein [Solirubrobacteraceae bacterium]|nr:PLP-dependent aminotransferase family protein [Solirubrobacteraceae bacterium]